MRWSGYCFVLSVATVAAARHLETYKIDKTKMSVSGFSGGAFFAVQFHVAFSYDIMGVGVAAGGPYYCAQDDIELAVGSCKISPYLINIPRLVNITHENQWKGTIDNVIGMRGDKVMLISGSKDTDIHPGVMKKLLDYYTNFVDSSDIDTKFDIPAEHAWLTDDYGHPCNYLGQPFINNCHYSAAYGILSHIYGDITPENSSVANPDNLLEFDQFEFFSSFKKASMDSIGYVYVPSACRNRSKVCRLHVALHGCEMSREYIDSIYVEHAGYNPIAEANDIIVLYPQTHSDILNPLSCFDWYGFTSSAYVSEREYTKLYRIMRWSGYWFVLSVAAVAAARRLETYKIDKTKVSVSGISSGAYFAVQFHVAFSYDIMGVGVVAGGPYYCAQDSETVALGPCMVSPYLINIPYLVSITHATQLTGTIDSVTGMRGDKVMLISGTKDTIIYQGVMKKLLDYYTNFVNSSDIDTEFDIPAQHAWLTNDYGHSCNYLGQPFINNCNYSAAYRILSHIYGDITPENSSAVNSDNLLEFDQFEFFFSLGLASMDSIGYVYVPSACRNRSKVCRLHVALHGCEMSREYISLAFVEHAGYNPIAEANNIIVLYPQTHSNALNPLSCFDWWGFTSPAYASKMGPQMVGVKAMIDRLAG
ncbi:uncharacterized protein LOC134184120 [Corticium candelabrum]|uniref:uncharacterized protein LOC134184120 n=1 Tax=Corticium candelabrum TaxID=121492 RepID=UPI002E305949|nr:uncharacterized protein LOC134184120 [Corticium candelabrum]